MLLLLVDIIRSSLISIHLQIHIIISLRGSTKDPTGVLLDQLDVPFVCISLNTGANGLPPDGLLAKLLPRLVIAPVSTGCMARVVKLREPVRDFVPGFDHQIGDCLDVGEVSICEVSRGGTFPASSSRTADSVDVGHERGREVEIEHRVHCLEVNAPRHQISAD